MIEDIELTGTTVGNTSTKMVEFEYPSGAIELVFIDETTNPPSIVDTCWIPASQVDNSIIPDLYPCPF